MTTGGDEQVPMTREVATEATTLAELSREVNKWTLHTDHDLHVFLKNYSAQLFERTKHLEDSVRDIAAEADTANVRLMNTFNQFLMLSNNQFIENRVYDEEQEELEEEMATKAQEPDGKEAKETKEPKPEQTGEATTTSTSTSKVTSESVVTKYRNALEMGIEAMKLFATMDDDRSSAASDPFDSILDIYNERPLPYIIGTREFLEDDTLGLGAGPDTSESESESDSMSEYSSSDVSDSEDSESVESSEDRTRDTRRRQHSSAESDVSSTESGGLFGAPLGDEARKRSMQRKSLPRAESIGEGNEDSDEWSEESDSDESEDSKPIVRRRKDTEEVTNTQYHEPRPQATKAPKATSGHEYDSESSEDESGEEGLFGGPRTSTTIAAKPKDSAPPNDLFSELKARVATQQPEESSLFEDQESEVTARKEVTQKLEEDKRTEPFQPSLPSKNFFSESEESDDESTASGLFGRSSTVKNAPAEEKKPPAEVSLFPPKAVEDASSMINAPTKSPFIHDSSDDESDSGASSSGGLFGAKPTPKYSPPAVQGPSKAQAGPSASAKRVGKSSLFDEDDSDDDSGNELFGSSKSKPQSIPNPATKPGLSPAALPKEPSSASTFRKPPAVLEDSSSDDDDDGGLFGAKPGGAKPESASLRPAYSQPQSAAPTDIKKSASESDESDSDFSDGAGLFGTAPKSTIAPAPIAKVNEASAMSLFGPSNDAIPSTNPQSQPATAAPASTPAHAVPPAMKMPAPKDVPDSDSDWSDDGQSLFGVSAAKAKKK